MTAALVIIGGGGHGKVIFDAARILGLPVLGFFDDKREQAPLSNTASRCLGTFAELFEFARTTTTAGIEYICAIGDNRQRTEIASRLTEEGGHSLKWATLIHPKAYVSAEGVRVGRGSIVCAGAVVQAGSFIGDHCIINTCSSVDHDCRIADYVHIAPGVHICGEVKIGCRTLVGVGSSIAPRVFIADQCVIGAGSVILGCVSKVNSKVLGLFKRTRNEAVSLNQRTIGDSGSCSHARAVAVASQ